jgi:hypothetical protein
VPAEAARDHDDVVTEVIAESLDRVPRQHGESLGSCSRFVHTVLGKPAYCLQAKSMCGKYIQAQGTTTERPTSIRAGCGNTAELSI